MLSTIDHSDPGDETLQRYRYQHAFGAMLALGALRGTGAFEYEYIYCEHHEDLLGIMPDGDVHALQVKTRKKELGYWMLSDSALVHSIQRFVKLHEEHGMDIGRFVFVSNAELRDVDGSAMDRTKATSPKLLLDSCRNCDDHADLPSGVSDGFEGLRAACGCDSATLLTVLKRTDFVLGPGLLSFESELVADVLPVHPECADLSARQLRRLTRELIELFTYASSLPVDPNASVLPAETVKRGVTTPEAKRVPVSSVAELLVLARAKGGATATYAGLAGDMSISTLGDGHQVLAQKLRAGELDEQIPNMQRRLLSTFEWMREQQIIDAEAASTTLRQLEGVVEGVYADEQALVSLEAPPWGKRLYGNMLQEFRRLATADPQKVCNQDHERLFGITGLLAERCRIWWSPPFDVEAAS